MRLQSLEWSGRNSLRNYLTRVVLMLSIGIFVFFGLWPWVLGRKSAGSFQGVSGSPSVRKSGVTPVQSEVKGGRLGARHKAFITRWLALRVLSVVGVGKAGTGAGIVGWAMLVGFRATGSPPAGGVLFEFAHFGAAAAGVGFRAGAITGRCLRGTQGPRGIRQDGPGPRHKTNHAVEQQERQRAFPAWRLAHALTKRTTHRESVGGWEKKTDRTAMRESTLPEF